jgi:hypothetical protein
MESDFVTRQHIDSLVPASDPNIAEVLNNYKFPPKNPQPQPQPQMGGYSPYSNFNANNDNNNMFLGAMLGQMQANMQNQNKKEFDGFQLNINTEVLRWFLVLLLVATLIWLVFKLSSRGKSSSNRRLKKLERNYRKLMKYKRKNPKPLPDSNIADDFDDLDDFDDFDDLDLDDLDD